MEAVAGPHAVGVADPAVHLADMNAAQAVQAHANDLGPIGVWLRAYTTQHACTIDEALTALRVAKPTLRTYQLAFRSIVRYWVNMARLVWDDAWDGNDGHIWTALVECVKTRLVNQLDATQVRR